MSSKIDEACEKVVEYLNTHGKARWSDLLQLGIPKTTLYRALEKLLSSGVVKRNGKVYTLAEKDYVAIVPMYAKQICEVIECEDLEALTRDLIGVGSSVRAVEKAYIEFAQTYSKTIEELGIQKLLLDMFKSFYNHRGFFTAFLFEVAKIYKGLKTIESCGACEVFQLCPPARSVVEAFVGNVTRVWGLRPEVFDEAEKVGAVLEKHGYDGKVRVSVLGLTTLKISLPEVILMSITSLIPSIVPIFGQSILKLHAKVIELGYLYYSSGCRPLGEKEKLNLVEVCKQLST